MYRLRLTTALTVIFATLAGATGAQANIRVGDFALVEHRVWGGNRQVDNGDDVWESMNVRTESASRADIMFVDKAQLKLGPTARVTVDRVVINANQFRTLRLTAAAGAVRWVSGNSASNAYELHTSIAIIRVHGTIVDLFVDSQRTTVALQEGTVEVCSIEPYRCKTLSQRGNVISVTRNAIEGPRPGGPGLSEFADRCLSAASKTCIMGASLDVPPSPPRKRTQVKEKKRAELPPPKKSREVRKASPSGYAARTDEPVVVERPVVIERPVYRRRIVVVPNPGYYPRSVYPRPVYPQPGYYPRPMPRPICYPGRGCRRY